MKGGLFARNRYAFVDRWGLAPKNWLQGDALPMRTLMD